VLRESIQAGPDNRDEAMEYALQFGRGLDTEFLPTASWACT
jgi:hypothetical protein